MHEDKEEAYRVSYQEREAKREKERQEKIKLLEQAFIDGRAEAAMQPYKPRLNEYATALHHNVHPPRATISGDYVPPRIGLSAITLYDSKVMVERRISFDADGQLVVGQPLRIRSGFSSYHNLTPVTAKQWVDDELASGSKLIYIDRFLDLKVEQYLDAQAAEKERSREATKELAKQQDAERAHVLHIVGKIVGAGVTQEEWALVVKQIRRGNDVVLP